MKFNSSNIYVCMYTELRMTYYSCRGHSANNIFLQVKRYSHRYFYSTTKIVVLFQNNIILILLMPQFSSNIFLKIKLSPYQTQLLVGNNNNMYTVNIKDNLRKFLLYQTVNAYQIF